MFTFDVAYSNWVTILDSSEHEKLIDGSMRQVSSQVKNEIYNTKLSDLFNDKASDGNIKKWDLSERPPRADRPDR